MLFQLADYLLSHNISPLSLDCVSFAPGSIKAVYTIVFPVEPGEDRPEVLEDKKIEVLEALSTSAASQQLATSNVFVLS